MPKENRSKTSATDPISLKQIDFPEVFRAQKPLFLFATHTIVWKPLFDYFGTDILVVFNFVLTFTVGNRKIVGYFPVFLSFSINRNVRFQRVSGFAYCFYSYHCLTTCAR